MILNLSIPNTASNSPCSAPFKCSGSGIQHFHPSQTMLHNGKAQIFQLQSLSELAG